MSTQQIQRCIRDVLGINDDEENDWTQGHMKKLMSATSTLYNTSLNKVMLKQGEETARCHLCAYIAAEKLAEKHVRDLHYYLDRVPLEPRKARNLLQLFQQNIFQSSPVKNFSWTPSPKKRRSPIKGGDRFTARDPKELREQLFGTPTKVDGQLPSPVKVPLPMTDSPMKSSPTKARRKLAFEEDLPEGEEEFQTPTRRKRATNEATSLAGGSTTDDEGFSDHSFTEGEVRESQDSEQTRTKKRAHGTSPKKDGVKKGRGRPKGPASTRPDICLLRKRYYKVTPAETIDLCNQFEIPKDVAYSILDHYMAYASFLVCPWQLVCGLVLNATLVVFTERRRKDPRVDHLIFEKMASIMKTPHTEDIIETLTLVKELVEGEKWYRDLQVKHNCYDGACYEEAISAKLGSMLQPNNILVSDEQLANWKRKIEQDLSLRDMQ